jgi:hypothetical protein
MAAGDAENCLFTGMTCIDSHALAMTSTSYVALKLTLAGDGHNLSWQAIIAYQR